MSLLSGFLETLKGLKDVDPYNFGFYLKNGIFLVAKKTKYFSSIIDAKLPWQFYALICFLSFYWALSIISHGFVKKVPSLRTDRKRVRDEVVHKFLKHPVGKINTNITAQQLHEMYRSKETTCVEIARAFCEQSRVVGKNQLCAVTEELYDEAHLCASTLDSESPNTRVKNMRDKPLWGIPISVKDCITQKGTDSTMGAYSRCFRPASEDGLQVALLRNAGAILHVRSNVPQLLLMPESENNVWGCSLNPWDLSRTPGGSSGGEAALIASGCSVMGLGSDIGGSIRIPAHYCGIVGFKPTPNRLTNSGSGVPRVNNRNGQVIIKPTIGKIIYIAPLFCLY